MSNMSYCRYRNTLMDLQDCEEALQEEIDNDVILEDELGSDELRARKHLIQLCKDIAEMFEGDND